MSNNTFKSRIHYKNIFLHIGHLQTIFYNNDIAREKDGICYAIVDDRQNKKITNDLKESFRYLKVKYIEIIPVSEYYDPIMIYTQVLLKSGDAFIHEKYGNSGTVDISNLNSIFQIRLNCNGTPNIGYTKKNFDGKYEIVFIFDYIIKVIDDLKKVNHVTTTTISNSSIVDITDYNMFNFFNKKRKINYSKLVSYRIFNFRYCKKDWPDLKEDDPRLLTLKGIQARHIPSEILYNFYSTAVDRGSISISYLDNLIKNYLNFNTNRVFGIIDPLKVRINNFSDNKTDFISKNKHPLNKNVIVFSPLSNIFYIDRNDFGLVEDKMKLTQHKEVRLKYGDIFYCTDIKLNSEGYPAELIGKYYHKKKKVKQCIHWISNESGKKPRKAIFYMYNWFFTGNNDIIEPRVQHGYIEDLVFEDLDQVYQLERLGYFAYDKRLSEINEIPSFIRICSLSIKKNNIIYE